MLPSDEQDGKGRISIILWGWAGDTLEEDGSPPLLTNDSRRFDNSGKGGKGGKGKGKGKGGH